MKLKKVTLLLLSFVFVFAFLGTVSATWWNGNWGYSKEINLISNVGNISYFNFSYANFSGHAKSDFSDLRFVSSDNSTVFNYTRENYSSGNWATFRVNNLGQTSFYIYYGNSGATYANTLEYSLITQFDDGANYPFAQNSFKSPTNLGWYGTLGDSTDGIGAHNSSVYTPPGAQTAVYGTYYYDDRVNQGSTNYLWIPVKAGSWYGYFEWSLEGNQGSGNLVLAAEYLNSSNETISNVTAFPTLNKTWQYYNGTAPSGTEWVRFAVHDTSGGYGGHFMIDKINYENYYSPMFTLSNEQGPLWWNNSWNNYKLITITENSGTNLTNYSVLLNISYNSNMNSDFSDLRFVDSDGTTLLGYALGIDYGNYSYGNGTIVQLHTVNDTYTDVVVKIPQITANSNHTIYMYYGNPIASSESNVSDSTLYYDNFSGTSLSQGWTISGTSFNYSIGSGYLNLTGNGATASGELYQADCNLSRPVILEARGHFTSDSDTSTYWWEGAGLVDGASSPVYGEFIAKASFASSFPLLMVWTANNNTTRTGTNLGGGATQNFYLTWSATYLNLTNVDNGIANFSVNDSYNGSLYPGFWEQGHGTLQSWDFIKYTRYAAVAPRYSVGAERDQYQNISTFENLNVTNTGFFNYLGNSVEKILSGWFENLIVGTLHVTGTATVDNLLNLSVTTLPTCGSSTSGVIGRNTSGLYYCNSSGSWTMLASG